MVIIDKVESGFVVSRQFGTLQEAQLGASALERSVPNSPQDPNSDQDYINWVNSVW